MCAVFTSYLLHSCVLVASFFDEFEDVTGSRVGAIRHDVRRERTELYYKHVLCVTIAHTQIVNSTQLLQGS